MTEFARSAQFARFAEDDAGAITQDWTVITAGLLLLGTMVIYALFEGGIEDIASTSNETLGGTGPNIIIQSTSGYGGTDDGTDDGTGTCTGMC